MKKALRISQIILAALLLLLSRGCKKEEPESHTLSATNLSKKGATLNGIVNPNGLPTIVTFEYGTTTSYDSTVKALQSPLSGDRIANVSATLSGLTCGIVYHFRVKAENSHWTVYGSDSEFEYVLGYPPSITTLEVTNLTSTSATSGGNITNDVCPAVTDMGIDYWRYVIIPVLPHRPFAAHQYTHETPGTGSFTSNLTELIPSTTYYIASYATNSKGTTYGNTISFKTLSSK
jgi:hypothetical protein